jgi:hypothetical protein
METYIPLHVWVIAEVLEHRYDIVLGLAQRLGEEDRPDDEPQVALKEQEIEVEDEDDQHGGQVADDLHIAWRHRIRREFSYWRHASKYLCEDGLHKLRHGERPLERLPPLIAFAGNWKFHNDIINTSEETQHDDHACFKQVY